MSSAADRRLNPAPSAERRPAQPHDVRLLLGSREGNTHIAIAIPPSAHARDVFAILSLSSERLRQVDVFDLTALCRHPRRREGRRRPRPRPTQRGREILPCVTPAVKGPPLSQQESKMRMRSFAVYLAFVLAGRATAPSARHCRQHVARRPMRTPPRPLDAAQPRRTRLSIDDRRSTSKCLAFKEMCPLTSASDIAPTAPVLRFCVRSTVREHGELRLAHERTRHSPAGTPKRNAAAGSPGGTECGSSLHRGALAFGAAGTAVVQPEPPHCWTPCSPSQEANRCLGT